MKTLSAHTHTNVTFTLNAFGNDFTMKMNKIHALVKLYNGQDNIYSNVSHLRFDKKANVIGLQQASAGGTIVFHSHNCPINHSEAATLLVNILESFGLKLHEKLQEVVKTHRKDGSPYACPQTFIERVNA